MQVIKTQIKNLHLNIFSFLEEKYLDMDFNKFSKALLKEVGAKKAGFDKAQYLTINIKNQVFDKKNTALKLKYTQKDISEADKILQKTFEQVSKVLPTKNTNIYLLPTRSSFILKKMDGISGYSPSKNNLLIYINFKKGWQKQLAPTFVHEYTHTISYQHHSWKTILDSLIFEGLAEHFVKDVLKTKPSQITQAISAKQSKEIFKLIQPSLHSTSYNLYADVFFGSKKFPVWSGYTIGYNIISDVKKFSKVSWKELIKTSPRKLLKISKWI